MSVDTLRRVRVEMDYRTWILWRGAEMNKRFQGAIQTIFQINLKEPRDGLLSVAGFV